MVIEIQAAEPEPKAPMPITEAVFSRKTRSAELTYTLRVIQQPDHARACGSGSKAHADRRPVDPPPVVELRIHDHTGKEVTLSHQANFFLFATLETAGRSLSVNSVPVLTGVNVSSMAYLDRPAPAGYFLFPDLSVRHEGSYRLCFSLYEELKDPADIAFEQPIYDPKCTNVEGPLAPKNHMHWRVDVKSTEFQVYSAKKFPGLENSTQLSQTIADQGCRIRIRRDVRMRKREPKSKKSNDVVTEESTPSFAKVEPAVAPPKPTVPAPLPSIAPTPPVMDRPVQQAPPPPMIIEAASAAPVENTRPHVYFRSPYAVREYARPSLPAPEILHAPQLAAPRMPMYLSLPPLSRHTGYNMSGEHGTDRMDIDCNIAPLPLSVPVQRPLGQLPPILTGNSGLAIRFDDEPIYSKTFSETLSSKGSLPALSPTWSAGSHGVYDIQARSLKRTSDVAFGPQTTSFSDVLTFKRACGRESHKTPFA